MTLSFPAGQHEKICNVFPKDQYIEVGSDARIVCQSSCVQGKIFWTLNNIPIDERLSNTINSSYTLLSLKNFTRHSATLQCHSTDTQQVLGGTTIRTYCKKCFWYLYCESLTKSAAHCPDSRFNWTEQCFSLDVYALLSVWLSTILEVNMAVDACSEITYRLCLPAFFPLHSKTQQNIMHLALWSLFSGRYTRTAHMQLGASDEFFNENKLHCAVSFIFPPLLCEY